MSAHALTNRESLLAARIREETGVKVAECYQCGKCTAGCPMARWMDISPNQIMRNLQTGDEADENRLLSCQALWHCAGCLTCTQRCPKGLDPAAVMDVLREAARRRGTVPASARKVLAFHEAFLKTVEDFGRMNEWPLVARYKLATGDLFADVLLAPEMLLKGKLPIVPHAIRGREEVRRIFRESRKKEKR
ncbi:MAG: 4Fe-4S dicluster domain-containing protein [Elusimicrobia bacterium]|nr:4Fe-4S dicluster domain-containing protein [Elusimicrobiota bacterium]